MKKKIRSLILLFIVLACATACTESTDENESSSRSEIQSSSQVSENDSEVEYLDDLSDNLDFDGFKARILCAGTTGKSAKEFLVDLGEDDISDNVVEAVWKRGHLLEERFNIKIAEAYELHYNDLVAAARNSVGAGSDDYDIYAIHARLNVTVAAEGCMKNLDNINYIDFDKDYWNQSYLDNLSYKGIHYWAGGDITKKYYSHARLLYVNLTMLDQYSSGYNIYQTVMDGKWTADEFNSLINGVYADKNGNGQKDLEDVYGFISDEGLNAVNCLMFGAGTSFTKYEEEGVPMLDIDSEKNIDVYEYVHNLLQKNEYVMYDEDAGDVDTEMFANRQALFINSQMSAMENDVLRNMDDDFYPIPAPKYNEVQENYRVIQQDGYTLVGVPITVNSDNLDAIGVTLEGLASMGKQFLTRAYYETNLQDKYSRSSEMQNLIELITDSIVADFCYAWGEDIGYMGNTTMSIFSGNIQKESITSVVKKNTKIWQTGLEMLIENLEKYTDN